VNTGILFRTALSREKSEIGRNAVIGRNAQIDRNAVIGRKFRPNKNVSQRGGCNMASRLAFGVAFGIPLAFAVAVSADEPKPAELNQLRLYVPIPQLEERFGKDIDPVVKYIKALEKRAAEILSKEKMPKAKGLLIAVGIKSKTKTRIWCQAVDGEAPAGLLRKLEKELAKIEAVVLKKAPAAFVMEIKLFGRKPTKYPEFPDVWIEAAKKTKKLLLPPDELFKSIWPD
jgi:hypothetical protein